MLYRIGTFSKITNLSVKTLRYYDEAGLLKPVRVDDQTSYRWYDDDSYKKAQIIKLLREFEFTIQEMGEALPNIEDETDLAAFLKEKHTQLEERISSARTLQRQIETKVEMMKGVTQMNKEHKIEKKVVQDMLIASLRYKGRYDEMGTYIGKLFKAVGGNALGAPFAMYYDEEYKDEDADIEVAVPVKKEVNKDEVSSRMLAGQNCVSIIHVGPYDKISEAYKALEDYLSENGIKGDIPCREIYLKGPGMILKGNPEKYETEIMIPIV